MGRQEDLIWIEQADQWEDNKSLFGLNKLTNDSQGSKV